MQDISLCALGVMMMLSLSGVSTASAQMDKIPALKSTDKTGCYLTDGSSTGPTIVLAAGLYHEPEFPKEKAIKIIQVALSSGCNIEEPDEAGSTPLVAAILYNEPDLAKFLLDSGANPYFKISSIKKYLDGMDAFQILGFLTINQKSIDRSDLQRLLDNYKL